MPRQDGRSPAGGSASGERSRRGAAAVLVLRLDAAAPRAPVDALPPGFVAEWHGPESLLRPLPTHAPPKSAAYVLFHRLGLFQTPDFSVLAIRHEGQVAHGSTAFPAFFRFPFMGPSDLQIGHVLTEPAHRGEGLAVAAGRRILAEPRFTGRAFWYWTDEGNAASLRVAAKLGFRLRARGRWRLGVLLLDAVPAPGQAGLPGPQRPTNAPKLAADQSRRRKGPGRGARRRGAGPCSRIMRRARTNSDSRSAASASSRTTGRRAGGRPSRDPKAARHSASSRNSRSSCPNSAAREAEPVNARALSGPPTRVTEVRSPRA
jgi:RimJ/RimL family protein N-acetyltransferase